MELAHLQKITTECRQRGLKLHLDGARLWEVQPYYGVPLAEIAALFDTVYVSFYKGVGAAGGAALAGPRTTLDTAAVWAKRRGADVFSRALLALDCQLSLRKLLVDGSTEAVFAARAAALQRMVGAVTALVSARGTTCEGLVCFDPPTPLCAMVHCYLRAPAAVLEACHDRARERSGVRLWNTLRGHGHRGLYVTVPGGDFGQGRLERVLDNEAGEYMYFEWSVGKGNEDVQTADVERGWALFLDELLPVLGRGDVLGAAQVGDKRGREVE